MATIDKTIEIPYGTEVEVSIDVDEFLDDVDADDILDFLVGSIGCKDIFRKMQMQHDFEKEDIEEAYGQVFGNESVTADLVSDAIKAGDLDSQEVLNHIPMVDIQGYNKGLPKEPMLVNDIINHINSNANAHDKLRIMRAVLMPFGVEDEA